MRLTRSTPCHTAVLVLRILALAVTAALLGFLLYAWTRGRTPEDPWFWLQCGGLALFGAAVVLFVLSKPRSRTRGLADVLLYVAVGIFCLLGVIYVIQFLQQVP
jgi:hypothetical protein